MAIVLNQRTEDILDSVLRSLNADTLRLPEVPLTAQISGRLRLDAALGQAFIRVDNGHLWPKQAYVRFPGAADELIKYVAVSSPNGNKSPTWDGRGNTPVAILRCDTNLVNNHVDGDLIYVVPESHVQPSRAMDSGLVGVHDYSSFLKQLKTDLEAAVLTATGGTTSTVVDTGAFVVGSQVGNKVTMITGATAGEVAHVISNTADTLVLDTVLTAVVANLDTYQVEVEFYDKYITALDAYIPPNYTSTFAKGPVDTSRTPGIMGTTMVSALSLIIQQMGGTEPVTTTARELLARDVDKHTRLVKTTAATDVEIEVVDASLLPSTGNIDVGGIVATIYRNLAGKGGQGPNKIRLSAAIGAIVSVSSVVTPSPMGSVSEGRLKLAPKPHAFGNGMVQWVDAAIAAIEASTIPVV